jgi:hypothetical protein
MAAGGKGAVARIREDPGHEEATEEEPGEIEAVDIDLDALDEELRREQIGKPTTVKIDGKVVHVQHAGDWSASAMRAMGVADWDAWAAAVIDDPNELEVVIDADLRNYQMEAIARECARQARMSLGKSKRRSGSSGSGRRR